MNRIRFLAVFFLLSGGFISPASALDYEDYPTVRLRSLDKITARTLTFDAQVGSTVKFGDIYIKVQTCRKPPPVEKTEAAAFLQIWQIDKTNNAGAKKSTAQSPSHWIFSGWMFASSPALSAMDHPVYDVWVIDCLGKDPEEIPKETAPTPTDKALPDDGAVPDGSVDQPSVTPEEQKPVTEEKLEEQSEPEQKEGQDTSPEPSAPESSAPEPENFNGIY